MSPKRASATRKLRGAQRWIVEELQKIPPSATLSTSKLAKRIAKASGKLYRRNSVYLALRNLVSKGAIVPVRKGTQKLYQLAGRGSDAPRATKTTSTPPSPRESPTAMATETALVDLGDVPQVGTIPHKLALGEILVLSVGDGQVVTATNLHGRLVIERHDL